MDEDQKAFIDQLKYGQSFMLNGKRIDPKDMYVDKSQVIYAYCRKGLNYFCTCDKEQYTELADKPHLFEVTVFYTAPVSKPWVSLTDEEIGLLSTNNTFSGMHPDYLRECFRAIEAKLKEKNT